jgi:hypothetical protein
LAKLLFAVKRNKCQYRVSSEIEVTKAVTVYKIWTAGRAAVMVDMNMSGVRPKLKARWFYSLCKVVDYREEK